MWKARVKYCKVEGGYVVNEDITYNTIVEGYEIATDLFSLDSKGNLTVRKGFFWDGATGALDTENFMDASLVHDIFCILVNEGKLPKWTQALADEQMRMMCKEAGMSWIRRMWTYTLVRLYQINKKVPVRKWNNN